MVMYCAFPGTSCEARVAARSASSCLPLFSNSSAFLNSFSAAFRSCLETTDFGPSAAAPSRQKNSVRMARQVFIREDSLYRQENDYRRTALHVIAFSHIEIHLIGEKVL